MLSYMCVSKIILMRRVFDLTFLTWRFRLALRDLRFANSNFVLIDFQTWHRDTTFFLKKIHEHLRCACFSECVEHLRCTCYVCDARASAIVSAMRLLLQLRLRCACSCNCAQHLLFFVFFSVIETSLIIDFENFQFNDRSKFLCDSNASK